jgi:hypothetical protein
VYPTSSRHRPSAVASSAALACQRSQLSGLRFLYGANAINRNNAHVDSFIDENAGVAYVTTHHENTIDRVPLRPGQHGVGRDSVAGEPVTAQLVGPSSAAWGRGPHDYGHFAYVTTDGGTTQPPPDGIIRPARLLRIEL